MLALLIPIPSISLALVLAPLTLSVTSLCRRPTPLMSGPVRDTRNGVPHEVRLILVEQTRPGTPTPLMMELGLNAPPAVVPRKRGTLTRGRKMRGSMHGPAVALILLAVSPPPSACLDQVLLGLLITVFLPLLRLSRLGTVHLVLRALLLPLLRPLPRPLRRPDLRGKQLEAVMRIRFLSVLVIVL